MVEFKKTNDCPYCNGRRHVYIEISNLTQITEEVLDLLPNKGPNGEDMAKVKCFACKGTGKRDE